MKDFHDAFLARFRWLGGHADVLGVLVDQLEPRVRAALAPVAAVVRYDELRPDA